MAIKVSLQLIAKSPVDKVVEAVINAQATGEDPLLAAMQVKTELAAEEAVMEGISGPTKALDTTPPWEATPDNGDDPQEALRDLAAMGTDAIEKLYLVSRETQQQYQVLSYDPTTKKAKVLSSTGIHLHPTLGERETQKYFPVWR